MFFFPGNGKQLQCILAYRMDTCITALLQAMETEHTSCNRVFFSDPEHRFWSGSGPFFKEAVVNHPAISPYSHLCLWCGIEEERFFRRLKWMQRREIGRSQKTPISARKHTAPNVGFYIYGTRKL